MSPLRRSFRHKLRAAGILLVCGMTIAGCKAREIGVAFSDNQSMKVDSTWVAAVKSCWPDLAHNGSSDASLDHQLADPLHFRAAFTTYAIYSDSELLAIVAHPVSAAPMPDRASLVNSPTPVLTRQEAIRGIRSSQGSSGASPAEDALCSIHSGTPVGFR